jgi:hypothetical protein
VTRVVPFGLDEEQFSAMYNRRLERASSVAIQAIKALLAQPIGPGVDEAHIEVFLDEDGGAPSAWVYYHGRNNRVDSADLSIFPGRSMELDLGLELLADIDEQYFIEPETFPGLVLTVPLLLRWVAECWWKAGGWSYPLPTTLSVHDYGPEKPVVLSQGGT